MKIQSNDLLPNVKSDGRKIKKVTNKKAQYFHIQIPNIENANISKDFPLIKGDYVFVIYGDQIDLTREECNLLTHHLASNIVYHIGPTNVLIEENVLKLLGNKKQYYYDYFGRKDIIEKYNRNTFYNKIQ
ncbi:unnamed protein product [Rhizophagus irregularis]|nr:unnamed protein product [Rhizophagus irregularis]